jgi:hypothetical protein
LEEWIILEMGQKIHRISQSHFVGLESEKVHRHTNHTRAHTHTYNDGRVCQRDKDAN